MLNKQEAWAVSELPILTRSHKDLVFCFSHKVRKACDYPRHSERAQCPKCSGNFAGVQYLCV